MMGVMADEPAVPASDLLAGVRADRWREVLATELAVATGEVANLSIRNRIPGTIESITHGAVMTTVKIDIGGGDTLTAVITKEAAQDLGLADGDPVTALVKSTEVSLAID